MESSVSDLAREVEDVEHQVPEPDVIAVGSGADHLLMSWRIADGVLAIGLLTGIVVLGNLDHMPLGVDGFLAIRLTIKNVLLIAGFFWAWPLVLTVCGLYSPSRLRTGLGEWPRLLIAGGVGGLLAGVFPITSRSGFVTPLHALLFCIAVVPAERTLRVIVRGVDRFRHRAQQRRIVLVGSGPLAARLYKQLVSDPLHYITVLGFVDSEPQPALAGLGATHLGSVQDLERVLMHRVVDDVFIGLPVKSRYEEIQQSITACAHVGVPASYSANLFGGFSGRTRPDHPGVPVLSLSAVPSPDRLVVKRAMDLLGALILLLILAPVMLATALVIELTSHGPILYAQERYGHMKRRFRMYKFRTMIADADHLQAGLEELNEASGPAFKIRNDPRITSVGRFLRRTSIDELPQLWNVLRGDMSLVGPRPMATRDVGLFTDPWLMRRFSMPPGLTCLWQVSGRSDVSFDRWIELDLEYIERWSLLLDFEILLRTIPAVIHGRGAA